MYGKKVLIVDRTRKTDFTPISINATVNLNKSSYLLTSNSINLYTGLDVDVPVFLSNLTASSKAVTTSYIPPVTIPVTTPNITATSIDPTVITESIINTLADLPVSSYIFNSKPVKVNIGLLGLLSRHYIRSRSVVVNTSSATNVPVTLTNAATHSKNVTIVIGGGITINLNSTTLTSTSKDVEILTDAVLDVNISNITGTSKTTTRSLGVVETSTTANINHAEIDATVYTSKLKLLNANHLFTSSKPVTIQVEDNIVATTANIDFTEIVPTVESVINLSLNASKTALTASSKAITVDISGGETFYKGINSGGNGIADVEGNAWDAGWTTTNTGGNIGTGWVPIPATGDAGLDTVLDNVLSNGSGDTVSVVNSVPEGNYNVYVYQMEWQGGVKTYTLDINGNTVDSGYSITQNTYQIKGPQAVSIGVGGGAITVTISGSTAGLAGIRIMET